jgi:hypothetical protein
MREDQAIQSRCLDPSHASIAAGAKKTKHGYKEFLNEFLESAVEGRLSLWQLGVDLPRSAWLDGRRRRSPHTPVPTQFRLHPFPFSTHSIQLPAISF